MRNGGVPSILDPDPILEMDSSTSPPAPFVSASAMRRYVEHEPVHISRIRCSPIEGQALHLLILIGPLGS